MDYVPRKDAVFNEWQQNLVSLVTANQVAWAIPAAIVAALNAPKTLFETKYAAALNPENRTRAQVQAKNDALKAYKAILRQLVEGALVNNPLVSNEQRHLLRIPIYDKNPTPAPIPTTIPGVTVSATSGDRLVLRYEQEGGKEGTSKKRAKPEHISHLEFIYKVGEPAPTSPDDCNKRAEISRIPYYFNFLPADSGKRLYWFARWVNTRHQPGPWTLMGSINIP